MLHSYVQGALRPVYLNLPCKKDLKILAFIQLKKEQEWKFLRSGGQDGKTERGMEVGIFENVCK